jgi:hypothetical protein
MATPSLLWEPRTGPMPAPHELSAPLARIVTRYHNRRLVAECCLGGYSGWNGPSLLRLIHAAEIGRERR